MSRIVTPDGIGLHYQDAGGDGPPVLCLPGLTRSGRDFDFVAPHLARARLIRLDLRGRGGSDPAPPETYTVPHEARDVVALLDHLGLDRAAVLGTSRGGLVAMMLAATAKDRLTGVCLNDIGPVIDPAGLRAIDAYLGAPPAAATLDEAARQRAATMTGFANVPADRWRAEVERLYDREPGGLRLRYDAAGMRVAFDTAMAAARAGDAPPPDPWPLFDALDGLSLALVRGGTSNILSADTAAEMRRRRPDMLFAELPDRGHVPFLDEPAALAVLNDWIDLL